MHITLPTATGKVNHRPIPPNLDWKCGLHFTLNVYYRLAKSTSGNNM